MKKILLCLVLITITVQADFSRDVNGIVTDKNTKLQWQDNKVPTANQWEIAITNCEILSLDGNEDWRLPNINELTSLVNNSVGGNLKNSIFSNLSSEQYWSSTSNVSSYSQAWIFHFLYGYQVPRSKTENRYSMCVRGGEI